MTLFDYIVLFIFISSIIIGIMRGLIKEVFSLAAWVIAFFVANAYGAALAEFIPMKDQTIRLIIAFVSLFILTCLLLSLLIMLIDSLIKVSGLKVMDRGLGSFFGLLRGGIIVLAFMLVGGLTDLPHQPFWQQAMLRPLLEETALSIKPWLPDLIARHVKF